MKNSLSGWWYEMNEYIIEWQDKKDINLSHFVGVRGYGAKLICDLLEENGYTFSVKEAAREVGGGNKQLNT